MTLREQRRRIIMGKGKIETTKDGVKIVCDDRSVVVVFSWKGFPDLYGKFLNGDIYPTDKDTLDIEKMGERLREEKEIKDDEIICFFMHIIVWGGSSGLRVYRNLIKLNSEINIKKEIAKAIRVSAKHLQDYNRDYKQDDKQNYDEIKNAMKRIREINGLGKSYGHISYASKILRMLLPQHVGVYDSILARYLSYEEDACGYVEFCADCRKVADKLNDENVEKPKGGEWRVADVEAALFFHFYMLKKQ